MIFDAYQSLEGYMYNRIQYISSMQGVRRGDQSSLVEMYRARVPVSSILANTSQGGLTSSLTSGGGSSQQAAPEPESSRIRKLEKLIKKRL